MGFFYDVFIVHFEGIYYIYSHPKIALNCGGEQKDDKGKQTNKL